MLIPENVSPSDCVYYNAAFLLQILINQREATYMDLLMKVRQNKDMSISMFQLCLDWLYLINTINYQKGKIILCS